MNEWMNEWGYFGLKSWTQSLALSLSDLKTLNKHFFCFFFPLWTINEYFKLCLKKKKKKKKIEWKTYLAGVQNVVDVFKEFFDNNLS